MRLPLLLLGLSGLLSACAREQPLALLEGTLVVADTGNGRILQVEAATGLVIGEQCLREAFPKRCGTIHGVNACMVFGVDTAPDSKAGVVRAVIGLREKNTSERVGSVVQFVPGHPLEPSWIVEALDFEEELPESEICMGGLIPEDLLPRPSDGTPVEPSSEARCSLEMPHVAVSSPDPDELIVADTMNSRILWLSVPHGVEGAEVLRKLDADHPEWDGLQYPNNVQVLRIENRNYLLATYKGGVFPEEAPSNTGRIVLWDIHDPDDIHHVWSYPEQGHLAAVHHGQVFESPQGPLLLYAHSYGASDSFVDGLLGSVGIARFQGLEPPEYLADGLADPLEAFPFTFLREVELVRQGEVLLVTDSGCENQEARCGYEGRVLSLTLPELEATGKGGAFSATHQDQEFRDLRMFGNVFAWGMQYPFEADLLTGDVQIDTWGGASGLGACRGLAPEEAEVQDSGAAREDLALP